jgi:hypothetical protein
MNDTSAGSILISSLEESLNRLFKLYPDERTPFELSGIQLTINRIAPDLECTAFYMDESLPHAVMVTPTFEEIGLIGRYLFNFNGEEKNSVYTPKRYVVTISPTIKYNSVKEIVALILQGIDELSCNQKLLEMKAYLLDKAIKNNMLNTDKVFVFKNGATYNNTCTPIILPFITNLYELKTTYFSQGKVLKYLFDNDIEDNKKENLLTKYGYLSCLTYRDGTIPTYTDHKKEAMDFNYLFNSMWNSLISYPDGKGKLINLYKKVLENPTSGAYERELANKSIAILNKNSSSIIDHGLEEQMISESVKSFKEIKKKGYSDLEYSELLIEIQLLQYNEDKMYLITRIHKNINTALKVKAKTHSETEKTQIDAFITQMRELLDLVQNKKCKTTAEDFTIMVNYPKDDYESPYYNQYAQQ